MSQIIDISVAILAGGKSARFGSPKIYANFRGKSLIQCSIETSFKVSNSVSIISGRNSPFGFNQVKSFQDLIPDKGPLGGIYTALKIAQTPWIAIMPCDMPFLRPEIYQNLYYTLMDQRPIAVVFQQQIEPLVSIWPKRVYHELKLYLDDHQFNVLKVLRKLNVQKYHITAEPLVFLNINTRKDYQISLQNPVTESHASRS